MRHFIKASPLLLAFIFASCGTVGQQRAGVDNFDQVSPMLFRGAQPTEEGYRTLASSGIKTVINLRDSDDSQEVRQVHDAGMAYIHFPLDAETVTPADAQHFLALLDQNPGPVFVHCLVGRDRTGMAVAAYRVRVQGWTLDAALKDLYAHGHYWALFPKVRAAVTALAQAPAPMPTPVAGTPLAASAQPSPTPAQN